MTTGLSASRKTPGIYLAVILGGAGTSSGDAPKTILLQGNFLATAISAASPALSVAAGTMAAATASEKCPTQRGNTGSTGESK